MQAAGKLAKEHNLRLHLDGARLFNASIALGVDPKEICSPVDSVTFCLSKGLSAPVGSVLCGSHEFIHQAHRIRKQLGGGMRQAGIIAAAGLYAVENNRGRLTDDHRRARKLAEAINSLDKFFIDMDGIATNIIIISTEPGNLGGIEVVEKLKENGVTGVSFGGTSLRLVTHMDVDDDDIDRAIEIFNRLFG